MVLEGEVFLEVGWVGLESRRMPGRVEIMGLLCMNLIWYLDFGCIIGQIIVSAFIK